LVAFESPHKSFDSLHAVGAEMGLLNICAFCLHLRLLNICSRNPFQLAAGVRAPWHPASEAGSAVAVGRLVDRGRTPALTPCLETEDLRNVVREEAAKALFGPEISFTSNY
jgi:hypothetical protein